MNTPMEKQTQTQSRLAVAEREDEWGTWAQQRHAVIYGTISKVLLYSTGKYMQYPMTNRNGKG